MFHVVPSCRAIPADRGVLAADLVDRPPARPRRQQSRGRATCSSCSVKTFVGHDGSTQRQVRLRQISRTGRSKHGASTSTTSRRPWLPAMTPHVGQTHRGPGRLDPHREQPDVVVELDGDHVQLAEPDERVANASSGRCGHGARMCAVGSVEAFRTGAWSLPDLGPRPLTRHHDTGAPLTPTGTRKSRQMAAPNGEADVLGLARSRVSGPVSRRDR